MFGFGKHKKMQRRWEEIATQLRILLAFPRRMNGDRVPDALKADHYVLGFHFMVGLKLYGEAVKSKADPEEQGFVLINALSIALERDAHDLAEELEPLMKTPDEAFSLGADHGNAAYSRLRQRDERALEEFNRNIRGKYA